MPRHTPTLYPHAEVDATQDEDSWDPQPLRPTSYTASSSSSGTSSIPSRLKSRHKSYSPASSSNNLSSNSSSSQMPQYSAKYHDIYSQFLRRYRSRPEDPRNDPDSHDFQRGLGQLVDGGESDDEDLGRVSLDNTAEGRDKFSSLMLETEPLEPETLEDRERLEWQTMLASVLDGDVLKSEKTRIAVALATSGEEQNNFHLNIWVGIRAKVRGRGEDEERKQLEERRLMTVDPVISEVLHFRAKDLDINADPGASALRQVNEVIRHLDIVHTLYPTLKALQLDKPIVGDANFQAHRDALITWSNVFTSLRSQIDVLRKWTGSETLDVTAPGTNPESPLGVRYMQLDNGPKADGTTFLERVLKEESIQMTFAKGFMTTVHNLIGAARDAQVNLASLMKEMNLPSFERELLPLISFPTELALASLRVRLDYAQKLKDPEVLIIDQMADDLKLNIGIACTLKRQYEAFLSPDPGGNWNLPQCISEDYDVVVLNALTFLFKLIHWKLKSGAKDIYFKETDVIETQWPTFNDVALTVSGGSSMVAEQLCSLTNKLMVRVTNFFDTQVRVPTPERPYTRHSRKSTEGQTNGNGNGNLNVARKVMTDDEMVIWYGKVLDSVRLRYRKLQRFVRLINQRFTNSAEYTLEDASLELVIAQLVETDHQLIYTQTYEEEGTYIVASPSLREKPEHIRRILLEAFHVTELVEDDGRKIVDIYDLDAEYPDEAGYLLVLSPLNRFVWNGAVLMLDIPEIDLDLRDDRIRLIADGSQHRLLLAKQHFADIFTVLDEDGMPIQTDLRPLTCIAEQQAHLPRVNRELRKIGRATNRLAESIVDSVHHVRSSLREANKRQDLLESWYLFASEHGQHVQKYMDRTTLLKFNRLLVKLAISWVSFICDDCDPNERKTFKWAVNALEFTLHRTRRNNILQLPDDQFEMLRQKVASCMTLLISHFDILGARSISEARREKERQEEFLRKPVNDSSLDRDNELLRSVSFSSIGQNEQVVSGGYLDPSIAKFWERTTRAVEKLEGERANITSEQRMTGRVLDNEKLEDRSLVFLASFSSNISIRWQQGRFIGAGAFGSVYSAVNLDSGSLMAVKEIKFQELAGLPSLYSQIRDELRVMEMLHHPNVVEYYGIEVHRDKVYIFEEYCQGGSLAALLEHGRIEDEGIIQVYTMQMLEGLAYLHSRGIVHRDIKPDNILLDHLGVIKYVDFGAAKILARNQRSMQRSRRAPEGGLGGGLGMNNSLTGTPMYMSPEVIKNDMRGRYGAMDVWSLGCVVLEFATGKKPWSNLDNEWAVMFHIGVATQHPPLPEPDQLSELGIGFIKQCLTVDPIVRPTAVELMDHPWMLEFREALLNYEEAEMATSPPVELPSEDNYQDATVARQAAIIQEKEVEAIQLSTPTMSPMDTPTPHDTPIPIEDTVL
ncbi:kinase [Artomyces pyxidatus]|uniref:Kinase n=1 Tax=Artomyces pyxidatus TaxID=48021 RepID=A0ACB8THM6_9AGAM|nr:kinase [Artomyces pyxidatus]